MFLLAALSILPLPFIMYIHWQRERRFVQLLKSRGRFMLWKELKPRLQAGEGTLIVEESVLHGMRIWWTTDDVMQFGPVQECDAVELYYDSDAEPPLFVAWCFEQYLHPDTGKAVLTKPHYVNPSLGFFGLNDAYPPGFVDKSFFAERFPKMRVVMTVEPLPPK